MSTFTSCPLAFRFSYIDRLPEAPSAPASKGTLVHLALQHLMWRPPADRTIENGLLDLARAVNEVAEDPEFAHLDLTHEEWAGFHADAEVLLRRYFDIEDPTQITVLGVELRVTAETADGVVIRGIIDRLELDADGELVVTDYKTGKVPGVNYEQGRLGGVHFYAFLCEQMLGRRPARVQLLYLQEPVAIIATPTEQSIRGLRQRTEAIWQAVERACIREDFRPRPSRLCDYCNFQAYCPAFGGDPARATELLATSA
jgi:putative RecB family exonuclease